MKLLLLFLTFLFSFARVNSQTYEEIIDYVQTEDYGTTYTSYNSSFISNVSFHTVSVDYSYHYYAIVCIKS